MADLAAEEKRALLTEASPVEAQARDAHPVDVSDPLAAEQDDVQKTLSNLDEAVEEALVHLEKVCGERNPRPLREIGDTGTAVLTDAVLGLWLGMVPVLGCVVLAPLAWEYYWKKRHILIMDRFSQRRKSPTPGTRQEQVSNLISGGLHWMNMCAILVSPLHLWVSYKEWYQADDEDAQSALEKLRLRHFDCISTIASLLLTRILAVRAAEVRAQIEYYKAIAKRSMDKEATRVLRCLELPTEERNWCTSSPQCALIWVSTTLLLLGFAVLARLSLQEIKLATHFGEVFATALMIYSITRGFYRLMVHLTEAPEKMQANAEQLLLFRAITSHEDCAEWAYDQKKTMRDILSRNRDEARKKWAAAQSNADEGTETVTASAPSVAGEAFPLDSDMDKPLIDIPDADLGRFAQSLIFGDASKATALDLTVRKNLKTWWQVRTYLVLDFTDESCIADSALAIATVIIGCFLALAFAEWTAYIMPAMGTHSSWGLPGNGTDKHDAGKHKLMPLIVATVLACTIIITLVCLLLILMKKCVYMNTLWAADHSLLLDAAIKLELDGVEDHTETARTSRLIRAILQRIENDDRRQRLFGIVIDDRVIRGVAFTLACALLQVLWERLHWCIGHPHRVMNAWNHTQDVLHLLAPPFVNVGVPH